ncbi:MAG: hypothetical protein PHF84_09160 [bacterium]|nr:hypothetical protein [bacterium]
MLNFTQINNVVPRWISESHPSPVIISTRARIARNIKNFPYLFRLTDKQSMDLLEKINSSLHQIPDLAGSYIFIKLSNQSHKFKQFLKERFLITDYLLKGENKQIVIDRNEYMNIMINEEDHLRIQVIYPGLNFRKAYQFIESIESRLENILEFDFNEEFGYLTSCPTNAGTGLRVSSMMHLIGLKLNSKIKQITDNLAGSGFTVRGFSGEGSKFLGAIYQISNQLSLGMNEKEILDKVEKVTLEIEKMELLERKELLRNEPVIKNIMESFEVCKNSTALDFVSAMTHISMVKLGIDLKLVKTIPSANDMNKLLIMIQPMHIAFLNKENLKNIDIVNENKLRAKIIKDFLSTGEICLKSLQQEPSRL